MTRKVWACNEISVNASGRTTNTTYTEEVSLSLDKGSRQLLGPVSVEEGQGGRESGDGDSPEGALGNNSPEREEAVVSILLGL